MGFGPAKGLDFASFCRVVKTMHYVVIVNGEKISVPLDLRCFNVPIYNFKVEIE